MKKRTVSGYTFFLFFAFACFFPGIVSANEGVSVAKAMKNPQPAYEVPEEKRQKWESIQNLLERQYGVCIEHCGNDKTCLDKCDRAYETRLDREYKALMHQ